MFSPSKRALSMQESAIRKLDQSVAAQKDVRFVRLNIGQPDVATPRPVLDAIASYQPEVVGYGPASGTPACREAVAAYCARWSPGVGPMDVAITSGGSEALLFAFTVIGDPGDDVLVPEPYYTNYNGFATVAGMAVRPIPTSIVDGFALPSDAALDLLVGPRTRAIVFSNPGNPTGAVYGRDELERVVAWAGRRGLFVIADEVYRRIWFERPPTSAMELEEARPWVMVVDSMSKTWSACGLRLGFLLCRNPEIMERVERLGQARLGPQPLAQHAAIAALSLPEAYYDEVRHIYRARVDAMADALAQIPGVRAPRPTGAFYLMAELPVDDADAFARFLVTRFRHEGESLVVAPGTGFYANPEDGRRQVRLAAVLAEDRVRRGVELLGLGLDAWRASR
ncbi:MAG TPA: pyridoxal phosphate-dependent aminotransferase [Myxococcota bacterium]|nr:pyridoxal phosphate-dependent aminotransferase [Myxococcota bacterium]